MGDEPPIDLAIPGFAEASRVGAGAFGVVYRAVETAYRRVVAVKVLSVRLEDTAEQKRFERECQALGALSGHPNIVALYSAGMTGNGFPYLVMEFLAGGSLGSRLSRGPMEWSDAVAVAVKLSGALSVAHAAGIIHRDIKPDNVLVSSYGEPELADFGVARIEGASVSLSAGSITGTLVHAAPEVISGVAATTAADVWSLASTIGTLLTGEAPFFQPGDESLHPLIARILTGAPRDMRPLGIPVPVCDSIEAALAKDSWERPSAEEFGRSLQAAQEAMGIPPTPMATRAASAAPVEVPATEGPASAVIALPVVPVDTPQTETRLRRPIDSLVAEPAFAPPPDVEAKPPAADTSPVEPPAPAVTPPAGAASPEEPFRHKAAPPTAEAAPLAGAPPPPEPVPVAPAVPPTPGRRRAPLLIGVAAVLVVAAGVFAVTRRGSSAPPHPTVAQPSIASFLPPDNGTVWLANSLRGALISIDAADASVRSSVSLPGSAGDAFEVAETSVSVLALDRDKSTLWVVAGDGAPKSVPFTTGSAADVRFAVAAADEILSVDPTSGAVTAIDARTGEPIGAAVHVGGPSSRPVVDHTGRIWVVVPSSGKLVQIGVNTRSRGAAVGQQTVVGHAGDDLRLVTLDGGLLLMDITTRQTIVGPGTSGARSFALPLDNKRVTVSAKDNGGVVPVVENNGSLVVAVSATGATRIDAGVGDDHLGASVGIGDRVYVVDTDTGTLLQFTPDGHALSTTKLCPFVCVVFLDVLEDHLWVSAKTSDSIFVIDPTGGDATPVRPLPAGTTTTTG